MYIFYLGQKNLKLSHACVPLIQRRALVLADKEVEEELGQHAV
jgi:hypothetical protein